MSPTAIRAGVGVLAATSVGVTAPARLALGRVAVARDCAAALRRSVDVAEGGAVMPRGGVGVGTRVAVRVGVMADGGVAVGVPGTGVNVGVLLATHVGEGVPVGERVAVTVEVAVGALTAAEAGPKS